MDSLIEMGTSAAQVSAQNYYKVTHSSTLHYIVSQSNHFINSRFQIHFLEVLELVKSRRCFIKGGFAYVTIQDFTTVLTHVFRTRLSKSLTVRDQSDI